MPSQLHPPATWLAVLVSIIALPLASCGGGSGDQADTVAADTIATDDTAATAAGESYTWDISPADVDRFVRALEAKNDTLRVESQRVRAIADPMQRSREWARLIVPTALLPVQARASGLSEERYMEVSNNLRSAYSALTGGAPDEETKRSMLDPLRAGTRQALERQIPRIRSLDEEADRLLGEAAGVKRPSGQ